jgi:hypothetical protein
VIHRGSAGLRVPDRRWAISSLNILTTVTKRLIDVDDDKMAAERALLGTRTLQATVDEAL